MSKHVYTIRQQDVGYGMVHTPDGKRLYLHSAIGRVLACDVGKRVYLVGDVLQVENDEQLARRLAKETIR